MNNLTTTDKYWATLKGDEFCAHVGEKRRLYFDGMETIGLTRMYERVLEEMFGMKDGAIGTTQEIRILGEKDYDFHNGTMASFLRQVVLLVTKDRLEFEGVAKVGTAAVMENVTKAVQIVRYIFDASFGENKRRESVWVSTWFGQCAVWQRWDDDCGETVTAPQEVVDPSTGQPVQIAVERKTGSVVMKVLCPWQYFTDARCPDDSPLWMAVEEQRSVWELIKRFPEQEQKLRSMINNARSTLSASSRFSWDNDRLADDQLRVVHWYHAPSIALEELDAAAPGDAGLPSYATSGRYVIMVLDPSGQSGVVLLDMPSPYGSIPVSVSTPRRLTGYYYGYAEAWAMFPNQVVEDAILSAFVRNADQFSRQTLFYKGDLDIELVRDGGGALKVPEDAEYPQYGVPAPMPDAHGKILIETMRSSLQEKSAINELMRGNSEAVSSGAHGALMHTIGVEMNSDRLASHIDHCNDIANLALMIAEKNASMPFVVDALGAGSGMESAVIPSEVLASLRKVKAKVGSPVLSTNMGRFEFAKMLAQLGLVRDPAQLMQVFETGRWEPITRAPLSERNRIGWENERLRTGVHVVQRVIPGPMGPMRVTDTPDVPVTVYDMHGAHMTEHKAELNDAIKSGNQGAIAGILAHMDWHARVFQTLSPNQAQLMGLEMPVMNAYGAQAAQQQSASSDNPPVSAPSDDVDPSVGAEMPRMPKNPIGDSDIA